MPVYEGVTGLTLLNKGLLIVVILMEVIKGGHIDPPLRVAGLVS